MADQFEFLQASMTLILGFYGSVTIQLGPNYSRLIQTNRFFVQSIKVENLGEHNSGLELYGFHKPPPLDINISWTEFHDTTVPVDFHKEWLFFFNKGSEVSISYSIKSTSYSPLSLVIVQGRESLLEWIEDPSYPNSTLSWIELLTLLPWIVDEETGWYDGQIWVKTAEVLARDRLLGSFSVKPVLSRLKYSLIRSVMQEGCGYCVMQVLCE